MRWSLIVSSALGALAACNPADPTANQVARLGWSFNYRDWTRSLCVCAGLDESACGDNASCTWDAGISACTDDDVNCTHDDVRDCGNQPADLFGADPYPVVTEVRVLLRDPQNVAPDWDNVMECALGEGDARLPIQGIARIPYRLTLEALADDGSVLYNTETPFDVDLTEVVDQSFELRTPVGDLSFDAQFPNAALGLCPNLDVTAWRYTLTPPGTTEPVLVGTDAPACEQFAFGDILANKLYIRNIPVDPQPGATSGWVPDRFHVKVEGLDATDAVLYCGSSERTVTPGLNTRHDSQPLAAGECASWTCDAGLFDSGGDCDCECGLWDPDCELPNSPVTGCGAFSVCDGQLNLPSACACMEYFEPEAPPSADCTWASQTPTGVDGTDDVAALTVDELTELCTWMVNYAGGFHYEHDCGGDTVSTGGVSQCVGAHTGVTCQVSAIEACYDAMAVGTDPVVADLCLLSTEAACDAYRTCLL